MDLSEAIRARHSVRQYEGIPLEPDAARQLGAYVEECNQLSGLHMQLVLDDSRGISGLRRLLLKNAENYLAIVGAHESGLEYSGGYWGEKVVLRATQLNIASCWFAMGAKKDKVQIAPGEKLLIVVALGNAAQPGKPHTSRQMTELYANESGGELPLWFLAGMDAAILAPTANNQQKFRFTLLPDGIVKAESLGGAWAGIDLGIACCHFEIGAGTENFSWAN
ncbi:MAG: nitroreductase [Coriobacteriales bacterium]|jgi:nitroreductase|nr:nitroreductase [Coriobacteriales bacterium]